MSTEKHRKHSKLTRPNFGAIENAQLAIWGLKCTGLKEKAIWLDKLMADHSIVYVDQIHENILAEKSKTSTINIGTNFNEELSPSNQSKAHSNKSLAKFNLAIFNGNHFIKEESILFYKLDRIESLLKRSEKIASIQLVLVDDEEIAPEIKSLLPSDVIILDQSQEIQIKDWLSSYVNQRLPKLKALILAGGKSSRMGFDKSQIKYENLTQEKHLKIMCESLGIDAYLSKNIEQSVESEKETIRDKFSGLGPYGGILSAFQNDPNSAWLVIACDLPLINKKEIENLISQRAANKIATAVKGKEKEFPEPLLTVWEPSAYSVLMDYLSQGYSCPRKVLINEDVKVIPLLDEKSIFNANTPEDLEKIQAAT